MTIPNKIFYVTTPIYYVNDAPHIGHVYTTTAADALARFKRIDGYDVFFLTGTDEHGSKVEESAKKNHEQPIELANRIVKRFQSLWQKFLITHNDFIRTTEDRHKKVVTHLIQKVIDNGDIYLGQYEDWYCVPCETFWTKTQLVETDSGTSVCPQCHREVQKLKEESYFFKMSKYEKPLLQYINDHPLFIQPESKKNEIVSFIKEGLRDLSISRATVKWGIPMPHTGETKHSHIIYIWFDALINYISALGYLDNPKQYKKYWPEALHIIGKDILRHHAIYWSTFLMSLGLPLPKRIYAHGWWTNEGKKMSKSLNNFVDAETLVQKFNIHVDVFRYFVLREIPFGSDGDFSEKAFIQRVNSDLANDFGNLLNRTLTMVLKYQNGKVTKPKSSLETDLDRGVREKFEKSTLEFSFFMDKLAFHQALEKLWEAIRATNKYLDTSAPWTLAKDEKNKEKLNLVLAYTLEGLRVSSILVSCVMPHAAAEALSSLGIKDFSCGTQKEQGLQELCAWWKDRKELSVTKIPPLFPKLEEKPS